MNHMDLFLGVLEEMDVEYDLTHCDVDGSTSVDISDSNDGNSSWEFDREGRLENVSFWSMY